MAAIKHISRDPDLKTGVRRKAGGTITGVELQSAYWEAASRTLSGEDSETDWVLQEWGEVLRLLLEDRAQLIGRVDWVTKLSLLETFMHEEHLAWDDPWLASLDLEYHNVSPDRGLFLGLEAEGKTRRLVGEAEIQAALSEGPRDTRAGIRGCCIRKFADQIQSVQWEGVRFAGGWRSRVLDLSDLFDPSAVYACRDLLEQAGTPEEAIALWGQRKETDS